MTVERGSRNRESARREALAGSTTPSVVPIADWAPDGQSSQLPDRYAIRETEEGHYLSCKEAPGVGVIIDRSYAFTEAEARKLGERVILLDGAGQFGPMADGQQQLYNLDHHEDCLRAFTLSTCEQALVLILKGLQLDKGEWRICANEPDLDTIFAIWVLLNHRRLRALDPATRDRIVPLLRLEGAIDANGFEVAEYCGLSQQVLIDAKAKLDKLLALELELKSDGAWSKTDLTRYTLERLGEIDHLVYRRSDFEDFVSVEEEYGHVGISGDHVAVVCRDAAGIYEVEKRLKSVWGPRLGLIALAKSEGHYTLRRAAALSAIDLKQAYSTLNLLDPAVDGRPPAKRWGGSDEIGGSPRPDGTGLTPSQVLKGLKQAFMRPSPWQVFRDALRATGMGAGLVAFAGLVVYFLYGLPATLLGGSGEADGVLRGALRLVVFALVVGGGGTLLTRWASCRRFWLYGWRRPAGEDWLALVPAVLLGAGVGGAWLPWPLEFTAEPLAAIIATMILAAVALEITFRGLAHGTMLFAAETQSVHGRWFLSRPALLTALLYAVLTVGAWLAGLIAPPPNLLGIPAWALVASGAMLAGIALGMIRERAASLWAAAAALAAGTVTRLLVELGLGG